MDNRQNLKRILQSGKEYKCEICGISEWQNSKIKLQVHHVDGDRTNNDLKNLQILCPNCHSQTDNFCSKNRIKVEPQKCKVCGKEIYRVTKRGLCKDCWNNIQKSNSKKPSKDELIKSCKELKSYSKVSKKYNVSDKTIRKWCESYGFLIKNIK